MTEKNDLNNVPQGQEESSGNGDEQDEARFNELAALTPAEYDRRREQDAQLLGIRVPTLDEEVKQRRSRAAEQSEAESASPVLAAPKPWDETVDGAELLDGMLASVKLHAVFPPSAAEAIVLWCIFAHAHGAARHSPVLALTSPEKGCGKTTVMGIVEHLVPKPLASSNITTAAVFRSVEKWAPTLLIDEADTFLSGKDDMRGVLNSGHKRSSAYVIRSVGDEHEPHQFRTWSPKVIAAIGELPDTLADRSINVRLRRRLPDEEIMELDEPAEAELQILCRKACLLYTSPSPRDRS